MAALVTKFLLMAFLIENAFPDPLEDGLLARSISSQQTLVCNSRSSTKKIIMSNLNESTGDNCRYAIRAYNTNVCQLRVDFRFFNLEQPQPNGTIDKPFVHCTGEHLSISGLDFNLCGLLNNQHIYIDWDVKYHTEERFINFQLGKNSKAMWFIEANQIECTHKSPIVISDDFEAPKGCLQYFYKSTGLIESFNYGSNYFGNSRYAICFDRKLNNGAMLVLNDIKFKMSGSNFDSSCLKDVYDEHLSEDFISMSHAEVVDGTNVRRHNLFCGASISGKIVRLHATGPIVIQVNADNKTFDGSETGFRFRYQILKS